MTIRTQLRILNERTMTTTDIRPTVSLHVLPNIEETFTFDGTTYKIYSRHFHLRELKTYDTSRDSIYEQEAILTLVEYTADFF